MNIQKIIGISFCIFIVISTSYIVYKTKFAPQPPMLFKTQKAERRDITNVIHAEGSLEAQGTSKIGSLIAAKVKKIYVSEGRQITKGTLLADLENDKGGDADVRQAAATLKKTQATYTSVAANYKREQALFQSGQIALESFEKATENYIGAQADVEHAQAVHDKEIFLLEQTHVYAPHDGTIVAIPVKEGQAFSPYSSTSQVLFEIAQNLSKMSVTLYIDENKMGDVKVGMQAKISVDAYPFKKPWIGTIASLSLGKAVPPSNQNQASVSYEAEIVIDNSEGLLRPGMTVHAKITLAKAKQALSVPGFVFQLNSKVLRDAAIMMKYDFKPIDHAKKKELTKQHLKNPIKTLWVIEEKALVEKVVELGISDNAYFQILSGVTETDNIITDDMTASDEIKKIAKQVAGS